MSKPVSPIEPAPDWSAGSVASVLPSVADRLGIAPYAAHDVFALPPARRTVVVLVDGMGYDLLRARSGHAPFLRSLMPTGHRIPCGFPSTTAVSMGSFGTGLLPGAHGLVGYTMLDPDTDRILNGLSWEDGPDPVLFQPHSTVFEAAEAADVRVTRIGPNYFDGSGLTNAALRGGRFRSGWTLADRVDATLAAVKADKRALVYLYWGELDKAGHVHGASAWQWGDELEAVDRELARLAREMPSDTSLVITADHGMVDVPIHSRVDVVAEPELMHGVRHMGGEMRAVQLYVGRGAIDDVAARWRERFGDRAIVSTRQQMIEAGWFGPVEDRVAPRIGDIVVTCGPDLAVIDSQAMRPELLALIGQHGATTDAELAVPVLVVPPRSST